MKLDVILFLNLSSNFLEKQLCEEIQFSLKIWEKNSKRTWFVV